MAALGENPTSPLLKVNLNTLGLRLTINGKYASVNYLGDKDYIDNKLRTLDVYITSLEIDLANLRIDNNYNSKSKSLHSIRGVRPETINRTR